MSANNQIIIQKTEKKWNVSHNDVDCGEIEKIGVFDTLEEAVDKANEFERECEANLFGVEYGIKIIK